MANVVVNDNNRAIIFSARVIAQTEKYEVMRPLIGTPGQDNTFIYQVPERYAKGITCRVPLRKAVTTAALEDGATYEGQAQKSIMSNSDITQNERGQVFGGFHTFEERQTVVDLRETHTMEAENWWAQDFDGKMVSNLALAAASIPTKAGRSSSQYNVEFAGDGESWDLLDSSHKLTPQGISRAKKYFQQRGIRPGHIGGNYYGYLLFLPAEATLDMQWDADYKAALMNALPRSEDHIFYKGHGLNPWGYIDGVYIIEDLRPVYGGTDFTFLTTEADTDQGIVKYQGIFMGAQGLAFYEWQPVTWFERIYDHGRAYEVSVHGSWGSVKPVINLGTLASASNRDYGVGYVCAVARAIS